MITPIIPYTDNFCSIFFTDEGCKSPVPFLMPSKHIARSLGYMRSAFAAVMPIMLP